VKGEEFNNIYESFFKKEKSDEKFTEIKRVDLAKNIK
jgi:hypothetical protein